MKVEGRGGEVNKAQRWRNKDHGIWSIFRAIDEAMSGDDFILRKPSQVMFAISQESALLYWKENMGQLDSCKKPARHSFCSRSVPVSSFFSLSDHFMMSWTVKEAECWKLFSDCIWKAGIPWTARSPWSSTEISPEYCLEMMLEPKLQCFNLPWWEEQLIEKKTKSSGRTELRRRKRTTRCEDDG